MPAGIGGGTMNITQLEYKRLTEAERALKRGLHWCRAMRAPLARLILLEKTIVRDVTHQAERLQLLFEERYAFFGLDSDRDALMAWVANVEGEVEQRLKLVQERKRAIQRTRAITAKPKWEKAP